MSAAPAPFEPRRFRSAAAHYLAGRVPYPRRLLARVMQSCGLGAEDRVLDLGCGPGQLARAFAPFVKEVIAVDPEPEMLALAAENAPPNLRTVAGSSYDLAPHFGRFRLVVMGRSFHWMDRADTLRRLDMLIERGGAIALFHDTHLELRENVWWSELAALRKRYEAAPSWRGPDWERHESVLLTSAFSDLEEIGIIERRSLTAEDVVRRVLSMSSTSPEKLGATADQLRGEIIALLDRHAPIREIVSVRALLARRA